MKALITGINGFAGSFLAEDLINKNWEVYGTVQPGTGTGNLSVPRDSLQLFDLDLLDKDLLSKSIIKSDPDVVFHLAGLSSVKASFSDPKKYFDANVMGSINLLEAIKAKKPDARVVVVTSVEVYGESLDQAGKTDENARLMPKSPYAVSKATVDMLSRMYATACGMKTVIARPASHIGPRQADIFFIPSMARQIAEIIKKGNKPILAVGNIDLHRDFLDVRDVVLAYTLLAEKGRPGEAYNICSGKKYLLRDLVESMIKMSGKSIDIMVDPDRLRTSDLPDMEISNSKIKADTGWDPVFDINDTLKETLGFWLNKVAS